MKKHNPVFQYFNGYGRLRGVALMTLALAGMPNIQASAIYPAQSKNDVDVSNRITGLVTDQNGDPIIGASVIIDGTTEGTITNLDGRFVLNVPSGKKVKISYVGFTPQILMPKQGKEIIVALHENTKILDEIVVVGYGSQKSKNVTGSITQVSAKEFEDLPVSNLSEALVGQINGLSVSTGTGRPGDSGSLSIRQSFNFAKDGGDATPLVIIDDVIQIDPNTGRATLEQFNMLDASEVESISVLRDASAAIYGSRASQGAIIVKTKRGQKSAPRISYSGKFSFNDAISHSKSLSAYEYGLYANSALIASGKALTSDKQPDPNKLFSADELEKMRHLDYNWLDHAWSSSMSMNHSLNVSGGTDRATYFAGATFFDQDANLGNQDYNKWTYRAGVDVKLTNDLKFSASVSGNNSAQSKSFTKNASGVNAYGGQASEQGDYNLLSHMPKYIPWEVKLDDGNTYYTSPALGPHAISGNAASANQIGSWNYFSLLNNGSGQTTKDHSLTANFSMSYSVPFIKGLSLRGTFSSTNFTSSAEQVQMPFTLALMKKNVSNPSGHLYEAHESKADYDIKLNNKSSRVAYSDLINSNMQMNFYVNYERTFGYHSVAGMFTVERTDAEYSKKYMLYDNPNDPYLGTSSTAGTLNAGNSYTVKSESGTLSYAGRINYSYHDRYLLQFMFRSDASTKFAPENYWGFFPGISAGWVMSEESWFKDNIYWMDFMKLRASWGQTGKDNIKAWGWKQTFDYAADKGFQFGNSGGTLGSGLTPGKTANRNVHWDKTTKWNVGADTRFLDGRLGLNIDLYYDRNSDMLNQEMASALGIPVSVGGAFTEENYGIVDAWGSEFSVSWKDKIQKVGYSIGVDFGFNDNKIKQWPLLPDSYPSSNTKREGISTLFPIWGYKVWKGTSSGDGMLRNQNDIDNYWNYLSSNAEAAGTSPKFFNYTKKDDLRPGMLAYQDLGGELVDGKLQGPDGQIKDNGSDMGKLAKSGKTYGFTTKLGINWKSLSVKAQIGTSWGGVRFIDTYKLNISSNQMLWSPESYWGDMFDEANNPGGRYPNIGYGDAKIIDKSDFWQINTLRCYLRNMSIAYTLPKAWVRPAKLESAKLSFTGNNLWDFYNPYPKQYRNMYDKSTTGFPTLRTWTVGVNLSF